MYAAAAGQVDHEMYLLGKPVDKAVDPMAQENDEVGLDSLRSAELVRDKGHNLHVGMDPFSSCAYCHFLWI